MTRLLPVAALALAALAGCSDDEPAATTSTAPAPVTAAPLRVDLIGAAVAALETRLGSPQDYYEINATSALVNLFVASGPDTATAWVYVGGELSSEVLEGTAGGVTFRAAALDFDPALVLETVRAEHPNTRLDVFEVLGGPEGTIGYTIIATSAAGGQLLITVSGEGSVIEVDTV